MHTIAIDPICTVLCLSTSMDCSWNSCSFAKLICMFKLTVVQYNMCMYTCNSFCSSNLTVSTTAIVCHQKMWAVWIEKFYSQRNIWDFSELLKFPWFYHSDPFFSNAQCDSEQYIFLYKKFAYEKGYLMNIRKWIRQKGLICISYFLLSKCFDTPTNIPIKCTQQKEENESDPTLGFSK